eukprot:gene1665-2008_t
MAVRLQQLLADQPITNLKTESARSFFGTLCSRLRISEQAPLGQQFSEVLTYIWLHNFGFWINDYVAVAVADPTIVSVQPEEAQILKPEGVLEWCEHACEDLQQRIEKMLESGVAAPDQIIECSNSTQSLLSIATAVQAALGANT